MNTNRYVFSMVMCTCMCERGGTCTSVYAQPEAGVCLIYQYWSSCMKAIGAAWKTHGSLGRSLKSLHRRTSIAAALCPDAAGDVWV